VLLSDSHELTLQMLQSPPSSKARVVAGYAGWRAGQLDRELAESGWLMLDVDPQLIFGVPPEDMWETAIRRLGADPLALQTGRSSGIH
jgi:putative transcriptional regulator